MPRCYGGAASQRPAHNQIQIKEPRRSAKPASLGELSRARLPFSLNYPLHLSDEKIFRLFLCKSGINKGYIGVPVHDPAGVELGCTYRRVCCWDAAGGILPGADRYDDHLPRGHVLFNLNRIAGRTTVLVERAFDAIALHSQGIPAIASLESPVGRSQVDLLLRLGIERVIVLTDVRSNEAASAILHLSRSLLVRQIPMKDERSPEHGVLMLDGEKRRPEWWDELLSILDH